MKTTIQNQEDDKLTLIREFPKKAWGIGALLTTSLACNITALLVPFMNVKTFLHHQQFYSLPNSVHLMIESKLYIIAALIVAFSMVFPFVKLALLTVILFFLPKPTIRKRWLKRLRPLGKWSFLDIFVVSIILILTNAQFFISAKPLIGIYFFIFAIALSMLSASAMEHLVERPPIITNTENRTSLAQIQSPERLLVPLLWGLSLIIFCVAVESSFIKVNQFMLAKHAYSILGAVTSLWNNHNYAIGTVLAIALIGMPLLSFFLFAFIWIKPLNRRQRWCWHQHLKTLTSLSMLDVFGLALFVFLFEGQDLVKTEIKAGLFFLIVSVAITFLAFLVLTKISQKYLDWD
ncbi:MAG: paraquat-inducible protein A [Candidatus Aceula meridiana]|nr:paraquat-inducible protein A [Candidatus Aceula meridiana]